MQISACLAALSILAISVPVAPAAPKADKADESTSIITAGFGMTTVSILGAHVLRITVPPVDCCKLSA